ncbi:MAG: lipopolysaccharide kinase InaA family protein [Pseudomonadales bacterium]
MTDSDWHLCAETEAERQAFPTLLTTWTSRGEEINDNLMSRLTKLEVAGKHYYIKAYKKRGKSFRRFFDRSRIRSEWENLFHLKEMNIPTLRIVAYGEETLFCGKRMGAMVTEELTGVQDLAAIYRKGAAVLQQKNWVNHVIDRLSVHVRTMHQQKFVHGDLKWRNILVNSSEDTEVYIFDCPLGRQLKSPFWAKYFERCVVKDLACLDKMAKQALSRTQRLKFYFKYAGLVKLSPEAKANIRKILSFFEGRE